ncbi:MFS transporter [Candidatus Woesearchaeota archaeon]|nr:MFS transporter [Candidatus Woesearchaeota archaeon]USN43528.1 MAG: MFS transporter [Candidatus Woesearchaeota archaeon]
MELQHNIWKLFILQLTQRRYYLPILSLYFLTLPNANAVQIGFWSGMGYLAEFLFEIPSGYISDKIGHKKMLVLAKLFMILAVVSFLYGASLLFFVLGAIFTSLSFAAQSGTRAAFLHETLVSLKKEDEFMSISTKITAYASLVSAVLITLIPYTTKLSLETPLLIGLGFDSIGFLFALSLVNPTLPEKSVKHISLLQVFKEVKGTLFLPLATFTGAITGFSIAKTNFIFPYLETLGFPIVALGVVLGLSAFLQFFMGKNLGRFEKSLPIKKILLFDTVFFPLSFFIIAFSNSFYVVAFVLILVGAYEMGRRTFVDGYLLKHYIADKRYKATILSIKGQISMVFNFSLVFSIGFFMNTSYKLGFYIMGGVLFFILWCSAEVFNSLAGYYTPRTPYSKRTKKLEERQK